MKDLKAVTNDYVLDALRRTEETVADALQSVRTARERLEALSNPDAKKPAPAEEEAEDEDLGEVEE